MISWKKSLISIAAIGILTVACEKNKTSKPEAPQQESAAVQDNSKLSVADKIKKYKSLFEAASSSCKALVDSNDMMRYQQNGKDITELKIPETCSKFYIHLRHIGRLPAQAMGHNLVVTKTSDAPEIAKASMDARSNNYLLDDNRILAKSNTLVGGGATDTKDDYLEVDTSKLTKGGDYTYFCSYPAHFSFMKGKLIF